MYCTRKITDDILWIGSSDRRLALFENVFPIPQGVSYNSYIVVDEDKTVLLDTVDKAVSTTFFENLAFALNGRKLDYVIVNHVEPDHCATIDELVLRYPEVKIVGNAKTIAMIKQFFDFDVDSRSIIVKENDTLETKNHTFNFIMAPMVHWPEVMVTYDSVSKILFSADAFGTFGALNGRIFADEYNFEKEILDEARRYYTNIVGKYGMPVLTLLKKASALDIKMICPLHGPIFRENLGEIIEKYTKWASYTPEEKGVMIAYASTYGNTENVANILACMLADKGVTNISMIDVSVTHPSYVVADSFKLSHLVCASTTYNSEIFGNMATVLHDLKSLNLQNRDVALIENGSWAATSGKLMAGIFETMKDMRVMENKITIKSSFRKEQLEMLQALADSIVVSVNE